MQCHQEIVISLQTKNFGWKKGAYLLKVYSEKCPICGKMNDNLYLEETDGWMECEYCHSATQILKYRKTVKIPLFDESKLLQLCKENSNE